MSQRILFSRLGFFCVCFLLSATLHAALTAEQKKELKAISTEIVKIGPLISKKKYQEAASAIEKLDERVSDFVKKAAANEKDSSIRTVRSQLEKMKSLIDRANGKGGVSFEKSVAGILARKCAGCHGEEPKAGLRLDTFAGLEKGGSSGPLLIPGEAENSLIIQRLVTDNEEHRMPLRKGALSEKEIQAIGTWIAEGARFEGDKTASMAELAKSGPTNKPPGFGSKQGSSAKPEMKQATGNETVHFMQDIMPELVDTCGRCHNDTARRSGFSVMSFEKLMKGGDSGSVITPGSLENSRLWRLVNGDETPVMPMGNQTGITRKWYRNLKTWIEEGAVFDGGDPKKNFPLLSEREATALSKLSPEQWLEKRKASAEEDWKKTFPKVTPQQLQSDHFLLLGDVTPERLKQVQAWAEQHTDFLMQTFKTKDVPLWKGKLAIFVFKDRFGFEEFNSAVQRREMPREITGISRVVSSMETAYIAVQDLGDAVDDASPGMQANVLEQVGSAFFQKSGSLPDWVIRGSGLALAHQKLPGNAYLASLARSANRILMESNLVEPEAIFADGTFSPVDVGPVGYTLVEFLLKRGLPQFGQFIQKLQSGASCDEAIKTVYRTDSRSMALSYANALPSSNKKGKK